MEATEATAGKASAQGEIRTPPGSQHREAPGADSRASLTSEVAEGRDGQAKRSASATFSRQLRPLVGGRVRPFRKTKGEG